MAGKRGPGRPEKSDPFLLGTSIWGWALCMRANKTPDALERKCLLILEERLNPNLSDEELRKREIKLDHCFRKWCRWKHVKKDNFDNPTDLGQIAEELYPGAARWLRTCLWKVIESFELTEDQINEAFLTLEPAVVDLIFEPMNESPGWPETHRRRKPFTEELADHLLALGTWDAFVASYLYLRLSQVISSQALFDLSAVLHFAFCPKIARIPEIEPYHRRLFDMLSLRCVTWRFPVMDRREEEWLSWRNVKPEFFEQLGGLPDKNDSSDTMKMFKRLIYGEPA